MGHGTAVKSSHRAGRCQRHALGAVRRKWSFVPHESGYCPSAAAPPQSRNVLPLARKREGRMQNVVRSVTRAIRAIIFSSAAIALAACGTDTADARSRSTMQRPTAPPQLAERRVAVTRVRVILQDGRPHAYVEGRVGRWVHVTQPNQPAPRGQHPGDDVHHIPTRRGLRGAEPVAECMGRSRRTVHAGRAHPARERRHGAVPPCRGAGGDLRLDPDPGPPPTIPEPPPDTSSEWAYAERPRRV